MLRKRKEKGYRKPKVSTLTQTQIGNLIKDLQTGYFLKQISRLSGPVPDPQTAASRHQTAGRGHHHLPNQDQAAQQARNHRGVTQTNSAVFWNLINNQCVTMIYFCVSMFMSSLHLMERKRTNYHIFPILILIM